MEKDTKHILTGVGIGAVVVGVGVGLKKAYDAFAGKKDDAANAPAHDGGGAPLETDGTIENEYTIPGAFALDLNQLPVLRASNGSTAGSSLRIVGDQAAEAVGAQFEVDAKAAGMPYEGISVFTQQGLLSLMAKELPGEIVEAKQAGEVLADVLLVVLSGDQPRSMIPGAMGSVAAYRASIMTVRQALPKTAQRILWLLTADAPPQVAKALNEAGEEWYRSVTPSAPASAPIFWKVVTATTPTALADAAKGAVGGPAGICIDNCG